MRDGHALSLADRTATTAPAQGIETFAVGDIGPGTDWRQALAGCQSVIHLAGETSNAAGTEACRTVNELGTERLVAQATAAGVETFLFLSSVMAVVDNRADAVVTDSTPSSATTAYGTSKRAAERHVAAFNAAGRTGIALRPPMVYGADAKGNWRRLARLAATGLPLPFGAIRNRRTMVSVGNLVDAIARVVNPNQEAHGGTYAVADAETLSLADIVRLMRSGRGRPPRLVPLPVALLATPLRIAGLGQLADSLLGNLEVDASGFRTAFSWSPPERAQDAIVAAAAPPTGR